MTDPGWDIPGIPREEPPAADGVFAGDGSGAVGGARSAGGSCPDTGLGLTVGAGESGREGKRRSKARPDCERVLA